MYKLLTLILFLWISQQSFGETTVVRPRARPSNLSTDSTINDAIAQVIADYENLRDLPQYPPRCAEFHESTDSADRCAHPDFVPTLECPNEEQVNRGQILMGMSEQIINAHNYRHSTQGVPEGYTYESRTLVCKMFKESTFRPQIESGASSAAGLGQVTRSTCRALFDRSAGSPSATLDFHSRIPGFENISDGDSLYEAMAGNMGLQIEVGLAVLQLKNIEGTRRRDVYVRGIRQLLELYYGSGTEADATYAQDIINCSRCVRDNNNRVAWNCLRLAKGKTTQCD